MARPRTPTSVLDCKGSYLNHPGRKDERANEPVPTGPLGVAPNYLSDLERAYWEELAQLLPPGVATSADRWLVELTVRLMAKVRNETAKVAERSQLITCLSKLGLTPADRSRVSASSNDSKSVLQKFLERNATVN